MFGKKRPEALVVGAGPVGLFAALQLTKRGIRVEIIDKDWRTGAHSYALALHPPSLRLLADLGLLEDVLDQAYVVQSIGIYDRCELKAEIRALSGSDSVGLVAVLQQDALESLLEEGLKSRGIKVQWNHELADLQATPTGNRVTIDHLIKETVGYAVARTEWTIGKTASMDVPFVIGADGHRSTVRRRMGIEFSAVGPAQHFAVFECVTNADLGHEMKIVLANGTANVLWPMNDGRCRWSFQLTDVEAPPQARTKDRLSLRIGMSEFPVLSEESFERFLEDRAPWFDAAVEEIAWSIVVPFEYRLAERFGTQGAWLVGDAGHTTGPVGMHSMNVGFREARDLARAISGVLKGGEPREGLQAYTAARIEEWNHLLGLEQDFFPGRSADPWIGDHRDQLIPCLPATGDELRKMAGQLCLEPARG